MGGRSMPPQSSTIPAQPVEKKKGLTDWIGKLKSINEEKDHWVNCRVLYEYFIIPLKFSFDLFWSFNDSLDDFFGLISSTTICYLLLLSFSEFTLMWNILWARKRDFLLVYCWKLLLWISMRNCQKCYSHDIWLFIAGQLWW